MLHTYIVMPPSNGDVEFPPAESAEEAYRFGLFTLPRPLGGTQCARARHVQLPTQRPVKTP